MFRCPNTTPWTMEASPKNPMTSPTGCLRSVTHVNKLKARIAELEAKLAEANEQRPYWLFRAMLESCQFHDCFGTTDGYECEESSECITEWCVSCSARKFLGEIKAMEALAVKEPKP